MSGGSILRYIGITILIKISHSYSDQISKISQISLANNALYSAIKSLHMLDLMNL